MRSVGKQGRDESGKYPVNEDDEEILRCEVTGTLSARNEMSRVFPKTIRRHCEERSDEAIHSAA
jgi:hypothetical protein